MPHGQNKIKRFAHWRINALLVMVVVMTVVVTVRLFDISVRQHSKYIALADDQHNFIKNLLPERGQILATDRTGGLYPLAANQELAFVYAIPHDIKDLQGTADKLLPVFDEMDKREEESKSKALVDGEDHQNALPADFNNEEKKKQRREDLKKKLDQPQDYYESLRRRLPQDLADKIKQLNLPGIVLEQETWRFYPENEMAAQTLGFVSFTEKELKGHYGVEGYFEERLAGVSGLMKAQRSSGGKVISVLDQSFAPPTNGEDIVLTVDRNIQFIIEQKLGQATKDCQAEKGSVVVVNPKTGAILALAAFPSYNPNYYYLVPTEKQGIFNNPPIFDIYEPGSTGKSIMMAAGIDAGLVSPDTTYSDTGSLKIGPDAISNFGKKAWGRQTMSRVIEQSLNLGMVFVTEKLGKERAYDYFDRFGFTDLTGITLDRETAPQMRPVKEWRDVDLAVSGYGQGYAINVLHLAMAYAVIANDGKLMQPYIINKYIKPDGQEEVTAPKEIRQVIAPSTAVTLSAMLVNSVEKGIASTAKITGYKVAGKTGTAQVPSENSKGYSDAVITSFVGYAPYEDPKFVMAIKFDKPKAGSIGLTTASPLFKEIGEEILRYYQIPPK